ncbi:unnamed protein product [Auanema sp. JU1783]|nr:unnamed protein product [Auanema sp. JU1783]
MVLLVLVGLLVAVPSGWTAIQRPEIHKWLEQNSYICVLDPIRNTVRFLTTSEAQALRCNCGDPLITKSACARRGFERPHCASLPDLCLREYQILFTEIEDRRNQPPMSTRFPSRTTTTSPPTTLRRRTLSTRPTRVLHSLPTIAPRSLNSQNRNKPTFILPNRFPLTSSTRRTTSHELIRKLTTTTPALRKSRPTLHTTAFRRSTLRPLHRERDEHSASVPTSRKTVNSLASTSPTTLSTFSTPFTSTTTPVPITTTTITSPPSSSHASTTNSASHTSSLDSNGDASKSKVVTHPGSSTSPSSKHDKLEKVRLLIKDFLQNMSPDDHISDLEKLFDFERLNHKKANKDVAHKHKVRKEIVRVSSEEVPATEERMQSVVFDEQMNLMGDMPALVLTTSAIPMETTTISTPTTTLTTTTVTTTTQRPSTTETPEVKPIIVTKEPTNNRIEPIIERLRQRIELLEARILNSVSDPGSEADESKNVMIHNFRRQMIDLVRRQENEKGIKSLDQTSQNENVLTEEDLSNLRSTTTEMLTGQSRTQSGEDGEPSSIDLQSNFHDEPTSASPRIHFTTSKFDAKNCEDNHPLCEYWAFYKQCGANAKYMYKFCRKACGICDFV